MLSESLSSLSNSSVGGLALPAATAALVVSGFAVYASRRWLVTRLYEIIARSGNKVKSSPYLDGNFAPILEECFSEKLQVEGKVPSELDGVYVRNGPNPVLKPTAGYHWFDGDGMVHATQFGPGGVSYCNRMVATTKLKQEKAAGRPLKVKFGDLHGWTGLALLLLQNVMVRFGIMAADDGFSTGNTALQYHAGKLLALNEGDLPYALKVLCNGLLETLGRVKVDRNWTSHFTAHPKRDSRTDELAAIGYSVEKKPYVTAGILDASGKLTKQWSVDTPYPVMMHDMALTETYIVLLHTTLVFDAERMVKQNKLPYWCDMRKTSSFGLLRRDSPTGKPDIKWFSFDRSFIIIHTVNAWEEQGGNIVKVYACEIENLSLELDGGGQGYFTESEKNFVTEYTLDVKAGTATSRRLTSIHSDFPVVHPEMQSFPTRWAFCGTMDGQRAIVNFDGIAKFDLTTPPGTDACVARIPFPERVYGGEALFVPRTPDVFPSADKEDDGFLLVYVYDEVKAKSFLRIYDAHTMAPEPLAVVHMPQRVPYGFHGTYMSRKQVKQQSLKL